VPTPTEALAFRRRTWHHFLAPHGRAFQLQAQLTCN
jgi:hypothetical protein